MKRIILHWTAGAYGVNSLEAQHYHFVIGKDGTVTPGLFKPEDNAGPLVAGKYAAHTARANTGAIGVAVDAMAGAQESPFKAGPAPITEAQVESLAALVAALSLKYDIPITRTTVLTHAEVEPTLGIKQSGKWDIRWLPGMDRPGGAVEVGDVLRAKAVRAQAKRATEEKQAGVRQHSPSLIERLFTFLIGIFGRKK